MLALTALLKATVPGNRRHPRRHGRLWRVHGPVRAGGWGGAPRWPVVSMALPVAIAVSSCSATASFQGQLPNGNRLVTDVSSAQAFRDHGLRVPATAHGLRYEADSQGDGYPLHAYFFMPCSGVLTFLADGSLSRDAESYDEPSSGLEELAMGAGWPASDKSARWYQRPQGTNANAEVMVSGTGPECAVYVIASK